MNVGDRLPEVELHTADGERVVLSTYLDRLTVIQLVRYYG